MIDFFNKGKKCWENHNGQSIKGGRCLGREESLSLREKRDVLKRDSKEFEKKNEEVRGWGRDWQLSDGCTFFFFLSHHFGNL